MKSVNYSRLGLITLVLLALLWGLLGQGALSQNKSIAIGSKNFPESQLLSELMASLIEAQTELKVDRQFSLGATGICFEALNSGAIDIYPEYTGTGQLVILKEKNIRDPEALYRQVSRAFKEKYQLQWLTPFGFNNTYALVMREAHADRLDIHKVSDLKTVQEPLELGFSHEFLAREDGYPGLAKLYELPFPISDVRGVDHGLAYTALDGKVVDVMDAYSTDGKISKYKLRILEDDKGYFPPYYAAPLVRADTLKAHPQLQPLLEQLGNRIDDATMQRLNFAVEEEGKSFRQVAAEFLNQQGLTQIDPQQLKGPQKPDLFGFMWQQRLKILSLTLEHLQLTGIAVGLAILFGVPLGIAIAKYAPAASVVLGGAGLMQTIPSLALLGFMVPFLGTGTTPAIVALTLYALLPIIRNTYTGLIEVSADVKEAARGIGLTALQLLFLVELPLATTVIMAGIRTATIIAVGTATLAAFIGAGGLGEPIVTGLSLNNMNWILTGVIPAALLALATDFLLQLLENLMAPRTQSSAQNQSIAQS